MMQWEMTKQEMTTELRTTPFLELLLISVFNGIDSSTCTILGMGLYCPDLKCC